jgi:hypothetical protein
MKLLQSEQQQSGISWIHGPGKVSEIRCSPSPADSDTTVPTAASRIKIFDDPQPLGLNVVKLW